MPPKSNSRSKKKSYPPPPPNLTPSTITRAQFSSLLEQYYPLLETVTGDGELVESSRWRYEVLPGLVEARGREREKDEGIALTKDEVEGLVRWKL